MSRETYQPPALSGGSSSGPSGTQQQQQQQTSVFAQAANNYDDLTKPVQYLCGECDTKVTLKKGDAIRCKDCGYRVLYKERTNR